MKCSTRGVGWKPQRPRSQGGHIKQHFSGLADLAGVCGEDLRERAGYPGKSPTVFAEEVELFAKSVDITGECCQGSDSLVEKDSDEREP